MAKGLEDTACYVYNRFVSVNEVGSSPKEFGVSTDEFHEGNLERLRDWPHSMLNTSTHDSKRSEDVRARLNVLSEMPQAWGAQALRWRRANRSRKRTLSDGRVVPDHNEEYLLYQTLAGAWPFDIEKPGARQEFTERITQYMTKAVHEAKVNLSWTNQNPEYVEALRQFITDVLRPGNSARHNRFLEQLEPFVQTVSYFGVFNSLAQVLLKITSPGVPDIYQRQETWDFSLVDPDNRRPVDFEARQMALNGLLSRSDGPDRAQLCAELLASYRDGRVKLWTTLQALRFRSRSGELFRAGNYLPVRAAGAKHEHLVAFARELNWRMAVTVVPRFVYTLLGGKQELPLGGVWGDTELVLPGNAPERFENVLTGETVECRGGRVLCRELFRSFPLALLSGQ
jgi:(1->4)-alpha-D-glucan 1-alpha-D-glucosylmutase